MKATVHHSRGLTNQRAHRNLIQWSVVVLLLLFVTFVVWQPRHQPKLDLGHPPDNYCKQVDAVLNTQLFGAVYVYAHDMRP